MRTFCALPLVLVSLVGCSGDGDERTEASSGSGEGATFNEFLTESFDPSACDGFQGCGDAVEGRFALDNFKICTTPDEFTGFEDLDSELD